MTARVMFSRNRAELSEVTTHLNECDEHFLPPLSSVVAIPEYSNKIFMRSERFEAWEGNVLIGMVAAYLNDSKGDQGFITSVSVLSRWRGQKIAYRLLQDCIDCATNRGFSQMQLSVNSDNYLALKLYQELGFNQERRATGKQPLTLSLDLQRYA